MGEAAIKIQKVARGSAGRDAALQEHTRQLCELKKELLEAAKNGGRLEIGVMYEATSTARPKAATYAPAVVENTETTAASVRLQRMVRGMQARSLVSEWKLWRGKSAAHLQSKARVAEKKNPPVEAK